jgi:hypothetical protein
MPGRNRGPQLHRLLTAAAALIAVTHAAPALGFWNGQGSGDGDAAAAALPAGPQRSASASGQTVLVTWTQTSFQDHALASYAHGGYTIRRYPAP